MSAVAMTGRGLALGVLDGICPATGWIGTDFSTVQGEEYGGESHEQRGCERERLADYESKSLHDLSTIFPWLTKRKRKGRFRGRGAHIGCGMCLLFILSNPEEKE
jgi:hypothetical protein